MFEGLDQAQLPGAIEAMLFVTDEPVGVIELADMLEADPKLVEQALVDLREKLEREQRGIQLREVAGGWRLFTHPAYHELIEKYVLSWDTRKLSQAAMETLAIVAYAQPVTRAGVASIRGVNSDSSINSLVEKGLVREAGTVDAPGNPVLYATTRAFLEKFGLRSTGDLPDLDQFAPDDATRAFIRERLSATREAVASAVAGKEGEKDVLESVTFNDDDEFATVLFEGAPPEAAPEAPEAARDLLVDAPEAAAAPFSAPAEAASEAAEAARDLLADAMAQNLGLVEKIDFDKLTFETDDE